MLLPNYPACILSVAINCVTKWVEAKLILLYAKYYSIKSRDRNRAIQRYMQNLLYAHSKLYDIKLSLSAKNY